MSSFELRISGSWYKQEGYKRDYALPLCKCRLGGSKAQMHLSVRHKHPRLGASAHCARQLAAIIVSYGLIESMSSTPTQHTKSKTTSMTAITAASSVFQRPQYLPFYVETLLFRYLSRPLPFSCGRLRCRSQCRWMKCWSAFSRSTTRPEIPRRWLKT